MSANPRYVSAESACILIVDDNKDSRDLMAYLLRAHGYDPLLASSGAEGVEIAMREHPDLILMDLQMPEMDGYEASQAIRSGPGAVPVPIVAITAFAMVGDRERVLGAGFEGYIPKPISPPLFVAQVEDYLQVADFGRSTAGRG